MTREEFSDMFTTLLNSYNTQANFGEEASHREVVLDEYEKSVLLTQAQDLIVKSYFDGTLNSQRQGFDDSARRQVDFSSLIKVADLTPVASPTNNRFDQRGILFQMPLKQDSQGNPLADTTDVLFILNEKLIVSQAASSSGFWYKGNSTVTGTYTDTSAASLGDYDNIAEAEAAGWTYVSPRMASSKEYVIIPINYKEYDREMSKPYAQPLKKQAWRLFQNTTLKFDVQTELIPKHTIANDNQTTKTYRIRYVRRPKPIVLEDMPNGLTIDGESLASDCELNPILHMDILNKAVELAITTRGYNATNQREAAERA